MPIRENPLVTGMYYHVFNRGVEKRITFTQSHDYSRFIFALSYFRHVKTPAKLSVYLQSKKTTKEKYNEQLKQLPNRLVTINAYCIMPNHFHILLKQDTDDGITKYIHKLTDSYTRYFNIRYHRVGHLFQDKFKSVLIENDEEFLHVSRYIHLNPYTANTSMTIQGCLAYPWSSARNYFTEQSSFTDTSPILSSFKTGKEGYKEFIAQQGAYQRSLATLRSTHTDM